MKTGGHLTPDRARLFRAGFAPQLLLAIKRFTVVEIRKPATATVIANPMASSIA
jgi:hypothetical protein